MPEDDRRQPTDAAQDGNLLAGELTRLGGETRAGCGGGGGGHRKDLGLELIWKGRDSPALFVWGARNGGQVITTSLPSCRAFGSFGRAV
jgi:hypothetical protein